LKTAPTTPGSGEHALRFSMMREVLRAYLGPVLLDSELERALAARKLNATSISRAELGELASDIMVGLRLFVPEERLPQLMLDLAELLEQP
jgi:hypothetical protein